MTCVTTRETKIKWKSCSTCAVQWKKIVIFFFINRLNLDLYIQCLILSYYTFIKFYEYLHNSFKHPPPPQQHTHILFIDIQNTFRVGKHSPRPRKLQPHPHPHLARDVSDDVRRAPLPLRPSASAAARVAVENAHFATARARTPTPLLPSPPPPPYKAAPAPRTPAGHRGRDRARAPPRNISYS